MASIDYLTHKRASSTCATCNRHAVTAWTAFRVVRIAIHSAGWDNNGDGAHATLQLQRQLNVYLRRTYLNVRLSHHILT